MIGLKEIYKADFPYAAHGLFPTSTSSSLTLNQLISLSQCPTDQAAAIERSVALRSPVLLAPADHDKTRTVLRVLTHPRPENGFQSDEEADNSNRSTTRIRPRPLRILTVFFLCSSHPWVALRCDNLQSPVRLSSHDSSPLEANLQ